MQVTPFIHPLLEADVFFQDEQHGDPGNRQKDACNSLEGVTVPR